VTSQPPAVKVERAERDSEHHCSPVLRRNVEPTGDADPFPVLSKEEKAKMTAAHSALLRKFTDLAFDESAEVRWQESQPTEADNIDVGPASETDLQNDLIETSSNPF
jgi:hypothetical protein